MKFENKIICGIIIIMLVAIIEQFTTDCYLPSFPAIAQTFSTTNATVQLSLSCFLFGEALAQPFFGFLSDYHGRRIMLLLGVMLFTFSSLICWFAPNIDTFLVGRSIQGFGVGSGIVLARAMAKDLFTSEKDFSQMVSLLSIIIILIPLLSPISGGYIQYHLGWRAVFMLIALGAFCLSIATFFFLPETFPKEKRHQGSFTSMLKSYRDLFGSKVFIINVMIASFTTAIAIIYITITPFLFTNTLKITPISLGWSTAAVSLGAAIGCAINAKLVVLIGINRMLKIGIFWMIIPILIMLGLGIGKIINLWVIMIPMIFAAMAVGLVAPNANAKALTPFPQIAGGASAIFGSFQFFIFAFASAVAAMVHVENQIPLAILLLVPLIITTVLMVVFREKSKNTG